MLAALLFAHWAHAVQRTASQSSGLESDFDRTNMRTDGDEDGPWLESSDYLSAPPRTEARKGPDLMPVETESKADEGIFGSIASAFTEVTGGVTLIDDPDHWTFCGRDGEMCKCQGGEVRFGRKTTEQEVWTNPVLLGSDTGVLCDLDHLQNKRVHVPLTGMTDEPYQCQCIERVVRISTEVMSFLEIGERDDADSSFLEEDEKDDEDGEDGLPPPRSRLDDDDDEEASFLEKDLMRDGQPYGDEETYHEGDSTTTNTERLIDDFSQKKTTRNPAKKPSGPGPWKMCMTVPVEDFAAEAARDEKISPQEEAAVKGTERMLNLELASSVYMKSCQNDDQEVWTFLLSSGQIRHAATGKCLAVHIDNGEPKLKANDCILVESPDQSQRWYVHFYTGERFKHGQGEIKLAIGMDSGDPYCLTTTSWDTPSIAKCKSSAATWTFQSPSEVGPHGWSYCANENGDKCGCNGEIKFGNKDMEAWTHAVPVPNELDQVADVPCSVEELRDIAIHDPVLIAPQEDPMYRECQCKLPHGKQGQYAGAGAYGMVTHANGKTEHSPMVYYGAIGAGVIIIGLVGCVLYQKKKKDELLYGYEEYEDEEEYEEDEEEEYYDDE